jgi:2-succinyl-5-enolpyruvyl-6-hydroxy-3-cyclohexene-1-carboxylate synthase
MSDIQFQRPLVILGGLNKAARERVRDFAASLYAPVLAEPLSGLREDPMLQPIVITAGERMLPRGRFDGVVRIGNVPTLRFWRDLETRFAEVPVMHFSDLPFTGSSRGEVRPLSALPSVRARRHEEEFFAADREMAAKVQHMLDEEPHSELAMLRDLSLRLPIGSRVYLGNSLPVREWDLVATREPRNYDYEGNRGANGIDGQLSTFLGWCQPAVTNVAVVGDLTAIYDLGAPWICAQLEAGIRFQIVIVNNGGGRIFSRVESLQRVDPQVRSSLIENEHPYGFAKWAEMWGLAWNDENAPRAVIELRPDAEASRRAWERYDRLWL